MKPATSSIPLALLALCLVASTGPRAAMAESIEAAADGTGTTVILNGNQFDVSGGSLSGDGTNLFHSFQQLGLNAGEIANFLSNPQIQNILGRVVGGDASVIDGTIQVSGGTSNLYLLNPAGMVFGPNAGLNVPASFTATTANGMEFPGGWFDATGANAYSTLNGTPNQFAFTAANPGSVVNRGQLSVPAGKDLVLLGGNAVNTGVLSAPAGRIVLSAVPGEHLVRISQEGMALSLEVSSLATGDPDHPQLNSPLSTPLSLPQLLTAGNLDPAPEIAVDADGTVRLTGSGLALPDGAGLAIASGTLDASGIAGQMGGQTNGQTGGQIAILGEKVGLISANIDASGPAGGGTVWAGGGYQGQENLPNAAHTFVSNDSTINVDAGETGTGGTAILWADRITQFHGSISARGGSNAGDGGFVEVSGKESLAFNGGVDVTAANGQDGTVLLDPRDIIIEPNDGSPENNTEVTADSQILFDDSGALVNFFIDDTALTGLTGNILLQAQRDIVVQAGALLVFNNQTAGESITFQADENIDISANIATAGGALNLIADARGAFPGSSVRFFNDAILNTNGGDVTISAAAVGNISTEGNDLTISAGAIALNSSLSNDSGTALGNVSLLASTGDISVKSIGLNNNNDNVPGVSIILRAPNGTVFLDGAIQAGQIEKTSDSTILIEAARFRGINPNNSTATIQDESNLIPTNLYAFPANLVNTPEGTVPANLSGKFVLEFAGDPVPKVIGTGNTLITVRLLQDTTFTVGRPLGSTGSGVEGFIGLGVDLIPPRIAVLLQNDFFQADIPETPTVVLTETSVVAVEAPVAAPDLTGLDTNTLTLQQETAALTDCDPEAEEDEILAVALDLPVSRSVDRAASSPNKEKLPPCFTNGSEQSRGGSSQ